MPNDRSARPPVVEDEDLLSLLQQEKCQPDQLVVAVMKTWKGLIEKPNEELKEGDKTKLMICGRIIGGIAALVRAYPSLKKASIPVQSLIGERTYPHAHTGVGEKRGDTLTRMPRPDA